MPDLRSTEGAGSQPTGGSPTYPDLSVIIVNWNTRELLGHCLDSVLAPVPPTATVPEGTRGEVRVEVTVVDNASADGSPDMVRARFPQVSLIANTENAGFARANNQAIPITSGRYILLLNPDTVVHPNALETLVRFMDQHPEAGGAGARLLEADGQLFPSCSPAPTLSRELWRLLHLDAVWPYSAYRMAEWNVHEPRQVESAQGACLILRRAALDRVGLLDEDYFIYSEEVDLCTRLRRHGWQIWWVPQALVTHYGGRSTRQVAAAMFLRLYQGKVLYFRKNHGPRAAQVYKLILLVAALPRIALSPLALVENPSARARHLTVAGHYGRLLRALPSL